ncbi:MAG: hypothetical protein D6761_04100 [Candidatus Dadabacteria bacterium]|nr:MAG: hypothetical protein D6761_04100 [Candidatus Dadabacteria bacterium]
MHDDLFQCVWPSGRLELVCASGYVAESELARFIRDDDQLVWTIKGHHGARCGSEIAEQYLARQVGVARTDSRIVIGLS